VETSHDDDDNDDDVEFAPRKAIKLEDAANSAGNLCWLYSQTSTTTTLV